MSQQALTAPPADPGCLIRLANDLAYRRDIARRSGLSDRTVLKIAQTKRADSYAAAVALERALDFAVRADDLSDKRTKGHGFYQNPSARALLYQAVEEGTTIARLLGQHGLTTMDLWDFVHAPSGERKDAKERVTKVLVELGLPTSQEQVDQ